MPKKQPDEKFSKDEADKQRDRALGQMLRTPPKLQKNEPKRSVILKKSN
jgi:hypothetical protein